jgi:hypothetical protein
MSSPTPLTVLQAAASNEAESRMIVAILRMLFSRNGPKIRTNRRTPRWVECSGQIARSPACPTDSMSRPRPFTVLHAEISNDADIRTNMVILRIRFSPYGLWNIRCMCFHE